MKNRSQTYFVFLNLVALLSVASCVSDFDNSNPYDALYVDSDKGEPDDTQLEEDTGEDSEDGVEEPDTNPVEPETKSCFSSDYVPPEAHGDVGAKHGEPCDNTADCLHPLLCIANICVAPGPFDGYCDGRDALCPEEGQECIDFQCQKPNKSCGSLMDCPSGFDCVCSGILCLNRECQLVDVECGTDEECDIGKFCDYGRCIDDNQCTASIDLSGSFSATSVLHLGVANESAVGGILNATQWLRDLLGGGGIFPGLSSIISGIISNFFMYNLQPYHIDLVLSLVDLADILEQIEIHHQVSLEGSCSEFYRGEMTFDEIQLTYKDQVFNESFANIPSIGAIPPAEFGATLQCGRLAIDEIHVDYISAGTVRYATDVLTQVITGGRFKHLEGALTSAIDCVAISNYVSLAMANPLVGLLVTPACQLVVKNMFRNLTKSLTDRPSDAGWVKIKGEADVYPGGQMENGQWLGTNATRHFDGEILF